MITAKRADTLETGKNYWLQLISLDNPGLRVQIELATLLEKEYSEDREPGERRRFYFHFIEEGRKEWIFHRSIFDLCAEDEFGDDQVR